MKTKAYHERWKSEVMKGGRSALLKTNKHPSTLTWKVSKTAKKKNPVRMAEIRKKCSRIQVSSYTATFKLLGVSEWWIKAAVDWKDRTVIVWWLGSLAPRRRYQKCSSEVQVVVSNSTWHLRHPTSCHPFRWPKSWNTIQRKQTKHNQYYSAEQNGRLMPLNCQAQTDRHNQQQECNEVHWAAAATRRRRPEEFGS
jgi:hypothetical protein